MTAKKKKKAPRKAAAPKRSAGTGIKINVERVRINRQGYDPRGQYWGVGQKLFRVQVVDKATDIYSDTHVRAATGREAKASVIASMMRSLDANTSPAGAEQMASLGKSAKRFAAPAPANHVAINMEGETDSELEKLSRDRSAHPGQRELAHVFLDARRARLAGMIDSALHYEQRAERLYEALPPKLRW